jgi:hypothetical protein
MIYGMPAQNGFGRALYFFSFIFFCFISDPAYSAGLDQNQGIIVINEVMASNTTTIQDRDGDYPDWIELFNAGDLEVDLTGYGLSDDPDDPFKWVFPNTSLAPGGFKLIFASDKNYSSENPYLHTNFKVKAGGELLLLSDTTGFIVDQINTVEISSDLSWGRQPDGSTDWLFFTETTPGESNTTPGFTAFASPLTFSLPAGFYQGSVSVEVTAQDSAAEIRYTLDGSDPQQNSNLYSAPIELEQTSVLRARTFKSGLLPGKILTQSYFLDENSTLPVISLSTDPANMFDSQTGIYVNYREDWERPVHFEFFETDGLQKVSEDAGIKIGGNNTRGRAQKAFQINFRGKYGPNQIEYQVFPDVPIFEFNNLYLRAAGNDWDQTHFRDGFLQILVHDLDFETQAYRPATIFLNGVYWGILNIRQRYNLKYFESEFGIDPENIDLLEHAHPNDFISAIEGDLEAFNALFEFIENNDLSSDSSYAFIQTKMEINSFLDWVISEIYFNNTDWPTNNVKMWRPKTKDGKFRWILFDLDWSYGYQRTRLGPADENTYKGNTLTWALGEDQMFTATMLRRFLENQQFKTEFINRFADYLNTVFHPDHVQELINATRTHLEPEMPRHYERFKPDPISKWYEYITIVENYAQNRPFYMREHIMNYFGLTKTVELSTQINETNSGRIKLNHISIGDSVWQGLYFTDIPVTLTAIANIGYKFARWSGDVQSDSMTITRTLSENISLVAHFEKDTSTLNNIIINEINYNSAGEFNPEDWLELHNPTDKAIDVSGWRVQDEDDSSGFTIPLNTIISSRGFLLLCQDVVQFNQMFPDVNNTIGDLGFGLNNAGEVIRLYNSEKLLVDSVAYDDDIPWPVQPDGNGPTLSLRDVQLDNSIAENWIASGKYGTPGAANSFVTVSLQEASEVPLKFDLLQNYPNPFNGSTHIIYSTPQSTVVTLKIYDLLGKEIRTLVDEFQAANTYKVTFETSNLPSGVYFYRLRAGNYFSITRKMLLLQ